MTGTFQLAVFPDPAYEFAYEELKKVLDDFMQRHPTIPKSGAVFFMMSAALSVGVRYANELAMAESGEPLDINDFAFMAQSSAEYCGVFLGRVATVSGLDTDDAKVSMHPSGNC